MLLSFTRIHLTFSLFAEGKPIPTELRKEEQVLRKKIDLEDDNTAVPRSHIDDEYAHAEERDPKILVTTSRDPSTRLVQFAKEMKLVLPNAQRINRGGQVMIPYNAPFCSNDILTHAAFSWFLTKYLTGLSA